LVKFITVDQSHTPLEKLNKNVKLILFVLAKLMEEVGEMKLMTKQTSAKDVSRGTATMQRDLVVGGIQRLLPHGVRSELFRSTVQARYPVCVFRKSATNALR